MTFALQARLPADVCALVGEYLLPPLPPQLEDLSKRWGRVVVAQTTRGELIIPVYTEEEATSCLGRFIAKTVTTRWSWELDEHDLMERGLDADDELAVTNIKTVEWNAEPPVRFEDLVEPRVRIKMDETTVNWLTDWSAKHHRPRPYDGSRITTTLRKAWERLEDSEGGVERAIKAACVKMGLE